MLVHMKTSLLALGLYALSATALQNLHPRIDVLGISASVGLGDGDGGDSRVSHTLPPPGVPFQSLPPTLTTSSTSRTSSSTSSTSRPTSKPTSASTWTSTSVSSSTKPYTTTVINTHGGTTVTDTITTSTVEKSTSTSTGTTLPELNKSGEIADSDDGGLDDDQVKIVAGVVGGVGGALVIGIIVFVVWRLRQRARRSEEHENLMDGQESSLKYSTAPSSSTPFQSTLDQYHNPGGRVNTSSNF